MRGPSGLWILVSALALPPAFPAERETASAAFRPLPELLQRYGLRHHGGETPQHIIVSSPYLSCTLEAGSRRVLANGVLVWFNDPLLPHSNDWRIAEADGRRLLALLLGPPPNAPQKATPLVLLDPGHGGADTGARAGTNILEKDLVLDIAQRTAEHLAGESCRTAFTRTNDMALTLAERTRLSRELASDILISIHCNWAESAHAVGVETFVCSAPTTRESGKPDSASSSNGSQEWEAASVALAYEVHRAVLAATEAPDRGIRNARFEVIREAGCPAILLECGFLSHAEESCKLSDGAYRDRLAQGIAEGICIYLERVYPHNAEEQPVPP